MSALAPCRCGHPGAGCSCFEERRREAMPPEFRAAVPPRPTAREISACSPDCGPDQDGGHWHQIVAPERMVWAGYPRYLGRPAAPDATAGDGLTAEDLIRAARAMDTAGVPADASPEAVTAVALVLRDVLAAAARDAELREAIARWLADTAAKPHGMPPYSDLSWAHVRHIWLMEADELLALPALRDVLAAAARDAELREAVTSLAVRFETLSEPLFSAASINAYDAAAKCLRRALDGTT